MGNEKIAMLHYGRDVDRGAVREKFAGVFRNKLDADGKPVPYATFRQYMIEVLDELDPDRRGQVMIIEQWIAEAESGRAAFHFKSMQSMTDAPFLSKISASGGVGIAAQFTPPFGSIQKTAATKQKMNFLPPTAEAS